MIDMTQEAPTDLDGRTLLVATCQCGRNVYASEAIAHMNERSGADKCPVCHTFATDHTFSGDEYSDFRCFWCDARSYSHR
jgi:hypothetical protein